MLAVDGSRWRCISLRVWLVRGHRAFLIANEACIATDFSALPSSTKTLGRCASGEGRSLTSAAGLSDCTRAELPLRSQMLSQRVWLQRFMVMLALLAQQRRTEGLEGRGRGTVSGSQTGREQIPELGPSHSSCNNAWIASRWLCTGAWKQAWKRRSNLEVDKGRALSGRQQQYASSSFYCHLHDCISKVSVTTQA